GSAGGSSEWPGCRVAARAAKWGRTSALGWGYDPEAVGKCSPRCPDVPRRNLLGRDGVSDEAIRRVGALAHPSGEIPGLRITRVYRVERFPECAGDDEDRSRALRIDIVGSRIGDTGADKRVLERTSQLLAPLIRVVMPLEDQVDALRDQQVHEVDA